ncbi:MAG: alpha-L-fucosidase [Gemmatimonadetes bacterium]|nr:alpha-L-fucosidase [Gemmatimonadota bacterium]
MIRPLNRREFLERSVLAAAGLAAPLLPSCARPLRAPAPGARGVFQPTWESLQQYRVPEWFRDAKLGIWAHWGPQCQPERGDWYAREMYLEGSPRYRFHVGRYGHPSKFGFKDVIHEWRAERWDPGALVSRYRRVGARYFFALANHHDNLDLWDSRYQPWNSVAVGPRQDIIGGWAKAARDNGLRFGVSVHASHAWSWYEPAQGADREGPLAGVPYDGRLTRADGAGQWWNGLDPQDLYAQDHQPAPDFQNGNSIHARWSWGNGITPPSDAYCRKFFDRTIDLVDRYEPDLLYFDDTALPFWPINDTGLRIAAHFYNRNPGRDHGTVDAVLFGKILDEQQRRCLVWDIERGQANEILPFPWQTDTCIGAWHYDRTIYEQGRYKTAETVVRMLVDIVSKNGNLLLNIPLRGDGSLDDEELAVLDGLEAWLKVNGESIFGTRPWRVFGEGPATQGAALNAQGFNEGRNRPYTAEDIRFATRGDTLYATALSWPESGRLVVKALAEGAPDRGAIGAIRLLGGPERLEWTRDPAGLAVQLPAARPCDYAYVLEIKGLKAA